MLGQCYCRCCAEVNANVSGDMKKVFMQMFVHDNAVSVQMLIHMLVPYYCRCCADVNAGVSGDISMFVQCYYSVGVDIRADDGAVFVQVLVNF